MSDRPARFAMRGATLEQVQPFAFDRGPIGCVLLHGFTAAPKEMRPLGEYLAARDFSVRGVRFAGHGASPEDLARTTWRDWVNSADAAIEELRKRGGPVWSIGLSLGGLVSLYLAEQKRVDGVVAIASPIRAPDRRMAIARWLAPFLPYTRKGLADLHDPIALEEHADYERISTRATAELYDLIRHTRRELKEVQAPLLIIFARHDRVVALDGLDALWQRVGSTDKEKVILERGGHIITEDYDKQLAFEQIARFLAKHTC